MYANAAEIVAQAVAEIYRPPERMTVDRWIEKHRTHSEEGASGNARGRWDCSLTPYLIGLMRAHTDPEPREIDLLKSTQIGATDGWFYNCVLYDADHGRSQLIVYPTQNKGQEKNRRTLVPAFKNTGPFKNITDDSKLTADELRLRNGTLVWFGYTGSRDSLRSDPCGSIKCDEIDAFDHSREDPLENCRSRARTFDDSKILKTSTPMGDEEGITREYDQASVKHQYHCPCPSCGQFFELWDFTLLGWMRGIDTDPDQAAANCWITCPHCSSKIREENKRWMSQHGLWITETETIDSDGSITKTLDPITRRRRDQDPALSRLTADFFRSPQSQPFDELRDQGMDAPQADALREQLGIRITGPRQHGPTWAFRCNTLVSLIAKGGWKDLVYGFVKAKGKPSPTWWRDNLGQSPTKTAKSIEVSNLMRLCAPRSLGGHEHGQCPAWMTSCFGAVDIQKDCIKIGVWAFGDHARRIALVKTMIVERNDELKLGEPRLTRAITDLTRDVGLPVQTDEVLSDAFEDRVARPALLIDTGHWTSDAYAWVHRLRAAGCRVLPCKGVENKAHDPRPFRISDVRNHKLESGERLTGHEPTQLVLVNTDYWKDELASRLAPLESSIVAAMIDENGNPIEPLYHAAQLPGEEGWVDEDVLPMAASIIREMCAEHKILIGVGSGRSGKDGRGPLREVWRKKAEHLKNDFGDIAVYTLCLAGFYGVYEMASASAVREGVPEDRKAIPSEVMPPAAAQSAPIRSGFRGGRRSH